VAEAFFQAGKYVVDIIWITCHITGVAWDVEIGDEFKPEFFELPMSVSTHIWPA
jgi:hypothetical protein